MLRCLKHLSGLLIICILLIATETRAYFDGDFDIRRHFLPNKENFFDWKAYQFPLAWRHQWYATKNGFQASAGSISQELFYLNHDIKLQADLHKLFSILYIQRQEEFYKDEPIYQQIEARFGKDYYISVLGFPAYEKKFDNLGLSLSYGEPYSMRHLKLTYLNQLANYNEKNQEDDRNQVTDELSRSPELWQFNTQYRLFNQIDIVLDFQQELDTTLQDNADGTEKSYKGHDYSGVLDWRLDRRWLVGAAFQWREERRRHSPLTPSAAPVTSQEILLHSLDVYGNVRLKESELTFGYLDSDFKNAIVSTDPATNYFMRLDSKQLYAKYQSDFNAWMKLYYSLQIGTFDYKKTGDEADDGFKFKGGLGIILFKSEVCRFLVLTTWAADSLADGQWDGGNMQLQITF